MAVSSNGAHATNGSSNGHAPMFDVAIIGGGPGGTTTGVLLKKYNPNLKVLICEREKFPREHIGESQLPPIGAILHEMGCWETVEKANFPVKLGGTYTWGKTTEPWIFGFIPNVQLPENIERPGKFEGWRQQVAFQVERSIYDKILLDHARSMGCDVRERTAVREVIHEDDEVQRLVLSTGEEVTARYYIDASGNAAILRRALGVKCDIPTLLKNVAFWNYFEDPEWANWPDAKATRIHIRSLPYGWIWFIRLGPTRASVGVVVPGDYYKKSGKRPEQLYSESLALEKEITDKLKNAKADGDVIGTTDWSFVVERTVGKNWFLVGECSGFADPILSAGLTLTQAGGRELAYTILELDRGEHDRDWLLDRYHKLQTKRVRQHMRFAEYWYSGNGLFDAVRENCTKIAAEAGLKMTPEDAFRWLSFGGLTDDVPGQVGIGGLDLTGVKQIMMRMTDGETPWIIDKKTNFKLNMANAKEGWVGVLANGRITKARSYMRGEKSISEVGVQGVMIEALKRHDDVPGILTFLKNHYSRIYSPEHVMAAVQQAIQALEVMATDHWVFCETRKDKPALNVRTPFDGLILYTAEEGHLIR